MLDKDILNTLKKHLKDVDGTDFKEDLSKKSKLKIHKFGEDIKSVNELIGALQVLDIALKKIILEARKVDLDFEETSGHFDSVVFNIEQLISQCRFMGMELFDCTMSASLNGVNMSFEISSPMEFVLQGDLANSMMYLEDKRDEIKQTLNLINQVILGNIADDTACNQEISMPFDKKDFLKMF